MKKKGFIIIISGPSGVGKGTIIREVLKHKPELKVSISACTREPRNYEEDGVHYHFLPQDVFFEKVKKHEFIEWCEVHSNMYGTLHSEVDAMVNAGQDVILEIDTQGARKIMSEFSRVISIFITPPTFEDLIKRLHNRNTEKKEVIEHRLSMAGKELAAIGEYDFIVVNNKVDQTVDDILTMIDQAKEEFS